MLGDEVVDCGPRSSTTTRGTTPSLVVGRPARRRRAGLAQPRVARGRRPDHDRLRRAALLRRLLGRPEDGRPGPRRARDGADAPRRGAHRPPRRALGRARRQPGPRRRPGDRRRDRHRLHARRDRRRRAGAGAGVRRPARRRPSGRVRRGEADGDARRAAAVRRRRDDQLGLPARPEPVPGGEGDVGGGSGREARAGRSSAPPSAATASPITARSATS